MIVPPPLLYMYNNRIYAADTLNTNLDSLSFYNSKYIQYISDSIFLENYMNAYIQYLEDNNLQVYLPDNLVDFSKQRKAAYIVRIAQMELVEDTMNYSVTEQINFAERKLDIPTNKISLSVWFDISQKDSTSYFTYFDEQYIYDEVYGDFVQDLWGFNIRYDYEILELRTDDIYEFASMLGEKHASYFYDLMLNTYIWNRIPIESRNHYQYLHYNSQYGSVEVADEAFIRVDEEE